MITPESEIARLVQNAPDGAFVKHYNGAVLAFSCEEPILPQMLTYVGRCCREWVLAYGRTPGKCGFCNERPTYLREDS